MNNTIARRFPSFRILAAAAAIASAVLIAIALYFQHVMGLEPCPLCVFQRVFVIAVGVIGLLAFLHNPVSLVARRVYLSIALLPVIGGALVAGRHVWLQHLPPDRVPDCGPGLDYILDAFPLKDALSLILKGSGECATVEWTFLGLSIPEWTLATFLIMLLVALYALVAGKRD
jgi:disulfide bond formation protein DsbB